MHCIYHVEIWYLRFITVWIWNTISLETISGYGGFMFGDIFWLSTVCVVVYVSAAVWLGLGTIFMYFYLFI